MQYLRKKFALFVGKVTAFLLKLVGRDGGTLPGNLALRICPDILKEFEFPKYTILVTGTNGKTSTANIIAKILKEGGVDVANNAKGDNVLRGVVSLLIKNSNFGFKIKREALVIEVDELTLAKNIQYMQYAYVVISNFFRDQLDRAGEMESVILAMQKGLEKFNGTVLLNADDPNVYRLKDHLDYAYVVTFGVEKVDQKGIKIQEAKEGKFCPVCSRTLKYDYYQYSHIGKYECVCGFERPVPMYLAKEVDLGKGTFKMFNEEYTTNIPVIYNIYNLVIAYAIADLLDISKEAYAKIVSNIQLELGRMENINGCVLNLVKNPTGTNEVIKYIRNVEDEKTILFLLNDGLVDGKDISWIWDIQIQDIPNVSKIICSGKRAYELAIRFKYEGYEDKIVVIEDMKKAVEELNSSEGKHFAISNYTGLYPLRKELIDARK